MVSDVPPETDGPQLRHSVAEGPLTKILQELQDLVDEQEDVTLRHVLQAFGAASFIPLMMIPALAVVSPLSGIPLFSSFCGITITLIAAQMFAGRDHVWLPQALQNRCLPAHRVSKALHAVRRLSRIIDRYSRRRISWLCRPPLDKLPQFMCLAAGLTMPFLELFPFSSSILGAVVLLICVGMLAKDGLFILLSLLPMAGAALIPVFLFRTAAAAVAG